MKRQLTQQEIDNYFHDASQPGKASAESMAVPFDFRRLDRIAKSQLSAIHSLHETFVRSLSSSLSIYLRAYASGNLISVEQLPYSEFADALPRPTCMVYFGMQPYEGCALIEINPCLVVPILDRVLGGDGKVEGQFEREITDIEENLLEGLFQIIAHELADTWRPVVSVNFAFDSFEMKPQLSKRVAPDEAVVAIAMELRVGDSVGMVNLAIPSITLRMMGKRFDQHRSVQKSESPQVERAIRQRLLEELVLNMDCELRGPSLRLKDVLNLKVGSVIDLGVPEGAPLDIMVNGAPKYQGTVVKSGTKVAVQIGAGATHS